MDEGRDEFMEPPKYMPVDLFAVFCCSSLLLCLSRMHSLICPMMRKRAAISADPPKIDPMITGASQDGALSSVEPSASVAAVARSGMKSSAWRRCLEVLEGVNAHLHLLRHPSSSFMFCCSVTRMWPSCWVCSVSFDLFLDADASSCLPAFEWEDGDADLSTEPYCNFFWWLVAPMAIFATPWCSIAIVDSQVPTLEIGIWMILSGLSITLQVHSSSRLWSRIRNLGCISRVCWALILDSASKGSMLRMVCFMDKSRLTWSWVCHSKLTTQYTRHEQPTEKDADEQADSEESSWGHHDYDYCHDDWLYTRILKDSLWRNARLARMRLNCRIIATVAKTRIRAQSCISSIDCRSSFLDCSCHCVSKLQQDNLHA